MKPQVIKTGARNGNAATVEQAYRKGRSAAISSKRQFPCTYARPELVEAYERGYERMKSKGQR